MANYNLTQTGAQVQQLLDTVAAGYVFLGTALPTDTPVTTNPNVCYLATTAGTYTNFGNNTLAEGKIAVLCWNGTQWTKHESAINVVTDATPTANSTNPVQSGGVKVDFDKLNYSTTVAEKISITPNVISGLRVKSAVIGTTSGEALYYIPVIAGKYYEINFAFDDGYVRFGYTTEIPANNVSVIGYSSGGTSTNNLSRTMLYTGYFCFSFVASAVTTTPTAALVNDGIGSNVAKLKKGRFSSTHFFEQAINELHFSGLDSTFVSSIDSYRFIPSSLNGADIIRLSAGNTNYDFRCINDGKSGVHYFRRDTSGVAEQGKGIYVLLDRSYFVTMSSGSPVTFQTDMVLDVATMPTIREYLTGLTNSDLGFITPTLVATKKGIGMSGVIEDTTNASFTYTSPIQVSRGDIVFVKTDGSTKFAVIAKTDSTASFYYPVVAYKGSGLADYNYIVDEDGYLAFTIYKGTEYFIRKVSSGIYAGIKSAEALAQKYDCSELYISRLSFNVSLTYADLMARYDALIAAYPSFMTKTKIGESENGQDLYEIKITSGAYNLAGRRGGRDAEISKPKFLIGAGIHGYEPGTPNSLYLFVRELVEGNPALSAIRNNVDLRIIPCMNPDGYDARTRTNHNGVDLNRNFNYNWVEEGSGTDSYSGASAASESETQAIQDWIDDNTDAVFCIDWHQSSFNEEVSCLGGTSLESVTGQDDFKKLYLEAINGIAGMLISRRGATYTSLFAYTYDDNSSAHGRSAGYIASKGICGGTLETQENFESSGNNSALTVSVGADIIGNLCKKAEDKYHI